MFPRSFECRYGTFQMGCRPRTSDPKLPFGFCFAKKKRAQTKPWIHHCHHSYETIIYGRNNAFETLSVDFLIQLLPPKMSYQFK